MFVAPSVLLFSPPDDRPPRIGRSVVVVFWSAIVLLTLACGYASAQAPTPVPKPVPKIEGLGIVPVGQEIRLKVTGLPAPKNLEEWIQRVSVLVDAPDGGEFVADAESVLGVGTGSAGIRIFFSATKGGTYVLILHDGNSGTLATKRITVGPVVPVPDPLVPPAPVATGRRVILLVREAREVTPAFNLTELELTSGDSWKYLVSKKHDLLILSDDRQMPSSYPPIAQAAFQKAKGLSLPAIAILDPASWAELYVGAVDKNATAAQLVDLIKKYGG